MDIRHRLVAHRGDHETCPENSLPAFARALDAGAEWLECDVQFAGDLTPVLLHDAHLLRLCGIDDHIGRYDRKTITALHVSEPGRLGSAFSDLPLLSLDRFLTWLDKQRPVGLFLEIKPDVLDRGKKPEEVVRVLSPLLSRCRQRIVVISSSPAMVRAAHDCLHRPAGWVAKPGVKPPDAPVEYVFMKKGWLDRVRELHRRGLKVAVYTVNEIHQLADCLDHDADLVETDHFESLVASWIRHGKVHSHGP
jgi:glycerophosphoryl diester phosphodiesterase